MDSPTVTRDSVCSRLSFSLRRYINRRGGLPIQYIGKHKIYDKLEQRFRVHGGGSKQPTFAMTDVNEI
jgi:hypothetical protein